MSPSQKIAWYNLVVIALAAAAYLVLYTLTGHPVASMAGFALLALLGCTALFVTRRKGEVLFDERDREIERKAGQAGFFIFWLYFVAACTLIPFYYDHQAVPSYLFGGLCWVGFMVLLAARSMAVLVIYRRDSEKSGAFLDSFREMTCLQKSAWMGLIILSFIIIPFLWFFPLGEQNIVTNIIGTVFLVTFALMFFNMRRAWRAVEMDEREEAMLRRAGKAGFRGLGITLAFGGLVLTIFYTSGSIVSFSMICLTGFGGFAAGLLAQPVSILVQYARSGKKIQQNIEQ